MSIFPRVKWADFVEIREDRALRDPVWQSGSASPWREEWAARREERRKMMKIEEKKTKNGSVDCGNGYWYFADPKYKSVRKIEIDDALVELLRNEKFFFAKISREINLSYI